MNPLRQDKLHDLTKRVLKLIYREPGMYTFPEVIGTLYGVIKHVGTEFIESQETVENRLNAYQYLMDWHSKLKYGQEPEKKEAK